MRERGGLETIIVSIGLVWSWVLLTLISTILALQKLAVEKAPLLGAVLFLPVELLL